MSVVPSVSRLFLVRRHFRGASRNRQWYGGLKALAQRYCRWMEHMPFAHRKSEYKRTVFLVLSGDWPARFSRPSCVRIGLADSRSRTWRLRPIRSGYASAAPLLQVSIAAAFSAAGPPSDGRRCLPCWRSAGKNAARTPWFSATVWAWTSEPRCARPATKGTA